MDLLKKEVQKNPNIHSMPFKDLPSHLKPREKAKEFGVDKLTDIELLAIFLRSGSNKEDVLDLSKRLINKFGGMDKMSYSTLKELTSVHGIGNVKAMEIKSLFEFSKRVNNISTDKIDSISKASLHAYRDIGMNNYESFYVILLDNNNKVIFKKIMYKGTFSEVTVEPKEVISLALRKEATKFYCFHNHPSGDLSASKADRLITTRLRHYSDLFGIQMLAHGIINNKGGFKLVT